MLSNQRRRVSGQRERVTVNRHGRVRLSPERSPDTTSRVETIRGAGQSVNGGVRGLRRTEKGGSTDKLDRISDPANTIYTAPYVALV